MFASTVRNGADPDMGHGKKQEAAAAALLMGVKQREQLNLPDGGIENNEANRMLLVKMIRRYRPAIVLANAVHDRHPDHANAAKLVSDAAFLAGLKKKITFDHGMEQEAWRPEAVYHYIQDYFIEPGFVIDIAGQMDKKLEAILTFKSQFVEPRDKQPNSILG